MKHITVNKLCKLG